MLTRSIAYRFAAATGLTAAMLIGAASAAVARQAPVTVIGPRAIEQSRSLRLSYNDLDLNSADGQRLLVRRIGSAARQVCAPGAFRTMLTPVEYGGCVDGALRDARPQVDRAVARAEQLSASGTSLIPAVGIRVAAML